MIQNQLSLSLSLIMGDLIIHRLKPAIVMVVVQIGYAGVNILYKIVAETGMNLRVLVAYRMLFTSAFMVPLALIFERKNRPKLTRVVIFHAFLCGLLGGALFQNLYIEGLVLTSPTFSVAMFNLIPAMTFILAISFGLEKPELGNIAGKMKVAGTVVGIGGAMLSTFYKGVQVNMWSTHVDLLHHHQPINLKHVEPSQGGSALGFLIALASSLSFALWLIAQAKMNEKYPCHYSSTALISIMASVQCLVYALCTERDWSKWKLGWDIRLLTAAYSGIVGSGLAVIIIIWCVKVRGPLFVSIFNPLLLLIVAIAGSLVLDEKLHLGSMVGGALIVCGLYMVLWGKSREMKMKMKSQLEPSKSFQESQCQSTETLSTSARNNSDNNLPNSLAALSV